MRNKLNKTRPRDLLVWILIVVVLVLLTIFGEAKEDPMTSDRAQALLQEAVKA